MTHPHTTGADDPARLRRIAEDVATAAGQLVRRRREELGEIRDFAMTKSSPVDPVTVVDTAAEEFIVAELQRLRPDDGVIAEEGSESASASGVCWIVDPIDGTVNFVYGYPAYAVSVGAAVDGEVVAGAVFDVAAEVLYSAAAGHGASRTDASGTRPIRVNAETDPAQALVATGFAYAAAARRAQAEVLVELLPQVRDIRRNGSAALDLCRLAEGHVDAYYEFGLSCWDFAAGLVIAREAGAHVMAPGLSEPASEYRLLRAAAAPLAQPLAAVWDQLRLPQRLTLR